jgi:hypothetical protein
MDRIDTIVSILNHINWNYGRGDIILVDIPSGSLTRRFQYGGDTRKFRIVDNKIYFLNHVRVIK